MATAFQSNAFQTNAFQSVPTIVGTLNKTLGAITGTASGKVAIAGALDKTLGAITGSSTGKVAIKGALAKSLGAITGTATGKVAIKGTLSKTLGAITGTGAGTVAIKGTLDKTLGAITGVITGRVYQNKDLIVRDNISILSKHLDTVKDWSGVYSFSLTSTGLFQSDMVQADLAQVGASETFYNGLKVRTERTTKTLVV